MTKKEISAAERDTLVHTLEVRFEKHTARHKGVKREDVQKKLLAHPDKLWSLQQMELTGGEPDVVGFADDGYLFFDCSPETPVGRRNLCYDRAAHESRKTFKPASNAEDVAASMGIEILTEDQYQELQKVWKFDTKTSSRLNTPAEVRKLGGAIFGDRRFDRVFVYHNGAESYYAGRGFRGSVTV